MVALRTIQNFWAVERRNQNAEEIAKRAGLLYDKFTGFAEAMEQIGDRLRQASEAHETAVGRLSSGRGNVVSQIEMLKVLGAKTTKSIPMAYEPDDELEGEGVPARLRAIEGE